jgi:hypothetical protein
MRSAAKVALIVGTVLNAINYGEQLWPTTRSKAVDRE